MKLNWYASGLFALCFVGCSYYPPNYGPIVAYPANSLSVAISPMPSMLIKPKDTSDHADYKRYGTIASLDFHYKFSNFYYTPSVYILGIGQGVSYVFQENTVLSGSLGLSLLPASFGSALSISQAFFQKRVFLAYAFNWSNFHSEHCVGICTLSDEGKPVAFNHLSLGFLINRMFLLDFRVDAFGLASENPFFGITLGPFKGRYSKHFFFAIT